MAQIKKIFRSFNFLNNKIFNAKVETPEHDEHIANKKFVEDQQIYSTEKAETYVDSFKHSWVKSLFGKNISAIFDDLFFPRVLPEFVNPEVNFEFTINDDYFINDPISGEVKNLLLKGKDISLKFTYDFILNDREETINPGKIVVLYPDDSVQEFYPNEPGIIDVNLIYQDDIVITFEKEFSAAESKLDSYGEAYTAPGFTALYQLNIDLTEHLIKNSIIYECPYISILRAEEGIPTYTELDVEAEFERTNSFGFGADIEGIFDILIPVSLFDLDQKIKYPLYINIFEEYDINDNTLIRLISKQLLNYDWLLYYTKDLPVLTINGIEFVRLQYNFGSYDKPIKCQLNLGNVFNSAFFV